MEESTYLNFQGEGNTGTALL